MNSKIWACASAGACVGSLVNTALPYLQALAALIAIACGLKAWFGKK